MDAASSGFVLGPSKCRILSIDEKREIVHELSKWPQSAAEKLQAWNRRDLLEVLCAEIGKERRYTRTSKQKMIEYLLKVLSQKKSGEQVEDRQQTPDQPTSTAQTHSKRPRKNDQPSHLPIAANDLLTTDDSKAVNSTRYCQNLACGATVNLTDTFCKRCSCCICYNYDKIKDPSLWLFCSSDSSQGDSCGLSCHLECILKHEGASVINNRQGKRLDASYYCMHCGKENNLLGCWKKQLMIAKGAKLVNVLHQRISLSHKLLSSTEKYQKLHEIVDTAMRKLEAEIGSITHPPRTAHGMVNKLAVGTEVQRLCSIAVESLESMLSSTSSYPQMRTPNLIPRRTSIREGISSTLLCMVFSLEDLPAFSEELVGFKLWHRKAEIASYPLEPTCTLLKLQRRFAVTDLAPGTEYMFKLVATSKTKEIGMWEIAVSTRGFLKHDSDGLARGEARCEPQCGGSPKTNSSCLSDPSAEGDELNNNIITCTNLQRSPDGCVGCNGNLVILNLQKKQKHLQDANSGSVHETEGSALDEEPNSMVCTISQRDSKNATKDNLESGIWKSSNASNVPTKNGVSPPAMTDAWKMGKESSAKKHNVGNFGKMHGKVAFSEGDYENCVKVVRWLECEGHIETNFRIKFLTWFSLRATSQERRVVDVYVNTLVDDPRMLASQLMDTFSEVISSKNPPTAPRGFFTKLWH